MSGKRKKEEGRRKKEDVTIARVSLIKKFLIVLAVAIGKKPCFGYFCGL
ncbi:hypothetical protein [Microcoleus vaginatus]